VTTLPSTRLAMKNAEEERWNCMKRQKRDRMTRAQTRGYQAGLDGKSREACPYSALDIREHWMGGWREARMLLQGEHLL